MSDDRSHEQIRRIFDDRPFDVRMNEVLDYQLENNPIYATFYRSLVPHTTHRSESVDPLPLLPIDAFKEARISTVPPKEHELVFQSSGTGGMVRSRHPVPEPELYRRSVFQGFDHFYSPDSLVCAWLPGYDENPDSSLIWMMNALMERDPTGKSRFVTRQELKAGLPDLTDSERPVVLIGAAFGLVDLAESESVQLPEELILIETGGMKTHRREMSKSELRSRLSDGLSISPDRIHSEYGMCELLSQAYARDGINFETPPWMAVSIRSADNPMEECDPGVEGRIGIIDLANVYSCPFLLTGDRGVMDASGRFQVLGRWQPNDLRGCNFLIDSDR